MAEFFDSLKVRTLEDAELTVAFMPKTITVRQFKKIIAQRTGMPIGQWHAMDMLFTGEELDDDRTLTSYGVRDDSLITCVAAEDRPAPAELGASPSAQHETPAANTSSTRDPPPAYVPQSIDHLYFKDMNDRSHTLRNVPLDSTVDQLLTRLAAEKGVDKNVRFIYGGKQLREGTQKTLRDYDIHEASTIFIVLRLPGGCQL